MSTQTHNRTLTLLGILTAIVTVSIQIGAVGELKGTVMALLSRHSEDIREMKPRLDAHEKAISTIEGRLHGIAAQVGKLPNKMATSIKENNGQ